MKYAIFQIDDSRQHYVDGIRHELEQHTGWEEVKVDCVDGRDDDQLREAQERWPLAIRPDGSAHWPKRGQLGIWYTVLNAIEQKVDVTFEDDAILLPHFFDFELRGRLEEVPGDADFFSLFNPRNRDEMFRPGRHEIGQPRVVRAYQPYGGVSMLWTEAGRQKFLDLVNRDGMIDQWDNQLYGYSWRGELNGYTSRFNIPPLVRITGEEQSLVQDTERL